MAPEQKGYLMANKVSTRAKLVMNAQHNKGRLIYDQKFIVELRVHGILTPLDSTTLHTLKCLGLLCKKDPAADDAAGVHISSGRSQSRRRRCDRKRKRGSRGGLTAKLKANPCRTPLPSVLLANVRSLENKVDYLKLDLTTNHEVRDCCVIILTETWLNSSISDEAVSMEGFTTFRSDRSCVLSGKTRGGGVCIYNNNRWCNNAKVISSHCSPDIEFLTIKCRPFYMPREFTTVIITAVYIPPNANTKGALSVLYRFISDLQTTHPDGVFIVAGDFNQANMKTVLPHFHQYVNFATRGSNTLDRAYTNIRAAYKAAPRPHLGSSDHLSVMLIPAYRPLLIRGKPIEKQVRVWPAGSVSALQDCFERTDWDMFKEAATKNQYINIEEYAETVSAYIQKCMEDVSATKTVITRENQKPWMTNEVRATLRVRNAAFKGGDREALRSARADLNRTIRTAKRAYGQKMQGFFQDPTNTKRMWQGIRTITDYKAAPLPCEDNIEFLNELNNYFGRFESLNNTSVKKSTPHPDEQALTFEKADVRRMLRKLNARKAAGPDNIQGRVLKDCADQLAYVLTDIFNISLTYAIVPSCFKTATIIPVPKKHTIASLNDYRPVALTPIIMKCFERLVKEHIISKLPPTFDPLQFAYRSNRSTEDAVSSAIHLSLEHLEKKNTYVRMLFLDFSSAFNTIIPQNLVSKLAPLGLNISLCNWLLDFLTERPQYVKVGNNTSSVISLSTGSPQGCVLSPLLFTMMTHDCCARYSTNHIIKYADDTTVVGLISDNNELAYREEVKHLVRWCDTNNLILNVDKTREIVVDFRKKQSSHSPLLIKNAIVEQVSSIKFLGVQITDTLTWSLNTSALVKRAQQRLYFLRRMRRANIPPHILTTFYRGTIESILTSCISVWFGSCNASDWKCVQRVVRTAEKIIGTALPLIDNTAGSRCLTRAQSIIKDPFHPNHALFSLLPSGKRFSSFKCRTTRFYNSFIPHAIRLLNSQ